mgnify:CR=1
MNTPRTIQHGKDGEDYHCRKCSFSGYGMSGCLQKAVNHSKKTGHTIDIYYESWREVTCYKKPTTKSGGDKN